MAPECFLPEQNNAAYSRPVRGWRGTAIVLASVLGCCASVVAIGVSSNSETGILFCTFVLVMACVIGGFAGTMRVRQRYRLFAQYVGDSGFDAVPNPDDIEEGEFLSTSAGRWLEGRHGPFHRRAPRRQADALLHLSFTAHRTLVDGEESILVFDISSRVSEADAVRYWIWLLQSPSIGEGDLDPATIALATYRSQKGERWATGPGWISCSPPWPIFDAAGVADFLDYVRMVAGGTSASVANAIAVAERSIPAS